MKKETLYLNQWGFNYYLIINELKELVLENGGFVVSDWQKDPEELTIFNRSINDYKIKLEEFKKIEEKNTQKELEEKAKDNGYIKHMLELKKEFENYDFKENNGEKITTNGYLHFVLNGKLYYIQFDENPFFDWFYCKNDISNDLKCSKNFYLAKLDKAIFYNIIDCYEMISRKQLQEIAKSYFDFLINASDCKPYKDKRGESVATYHILEWRGKSAE